MQVKFEIQAQSQNIKYDIWKKQITYTIPIMPANQYSWLMK